MHNEPEQKRLVHVSMLSTGWDRLILTRLYRTSVLPKLLVLGCHSLKLYLRL